MKKFMVQYRWNVSVQSYQLKFTIFIKGLWHSGKKVARYAVGLSSIPINGKVWCDYVGKKLSRGKISPEVLSRGKSIPEVISRGKSTPEVISRRKSTPEVISRGKSTPEVISRGKAPQR
jgi:hypothetical protein